MDAESEMGSLQQNGLTWNYKIEDGSARITSITGTAESDVIVPSVVRDSHDIEIAVVEISSSCARIANLSGVTRITIPSTIQIIGDEAFRPSSLNNQLSSLREVVFEDDSQLETIGAKAFYGAGVPVPDDVSEDDNTFSNCADLAGLTLSNREHTVEIEMSASEGSGAILYLYDSGSSYINKRFVTDYYAMEGLKINGEAAQPGDYVTEQVGVDYDGKSARMLTWRNLGGVQTISFDYHMYVPPTFDYDDDTGEEITVPEKNFYHHVSISVVGELPVQEDDHSKLPSVFTVVLPDSVKSIGDQCFTNLAILRISEDSQLEEIGESSLCSLIGDLYLPNGLQKIGPGALPYKARITLSEENRYFAITENGSLTTYDGMELVQYIGDGSEYVFPDGVAIVRDYAFKDNPVIKSITIPAGLDWGMFPFEGVASLTDIEFDPELRDIPDYLFGKSKITSITIPSTVRTIGEKAFYGTHLATVEFSDQSQLTEIKDYAFLKNDSLTKVVFGAHEDGYSCTVGKGSFFFCDKLEKVVVPEGCVITQIGEGAFAKESRVSAGYAGMDKAFDFVRSESGTGIVIPKEVEYIGKGAFSAVFNGYSAQGGEPGLYTLVNAVYGGFLDASGKDISFEEGSSVNTIDYAAFSGLQGVRTVDLTNCRSLNEIYGGAFHRLSTGELTISMPADSVLTKINNSAFEQEYAGGIVHDIVVPASVTEVGDSAFEYAASSIAFEDGSQLRTFGGYQSGVQSIDLSNCLMLESVYTYPNITLPPGFYEIYGNANEIANKDFVIFDVDSKDLVIGERIIAVNSLKIHGLDSISCDGGNMYFSSEDGMLLMGGRLVAVANGLSELSVADGSPVTEIGAWALKDSGVSTITIDKEGVVLRDGALDSAMVKSVFLACPEQTVFSQRSFSGNGCELTFYVPEETPDEIVSVLSAIGQVAKGYGDGSRVFVPSKMGSADVVVESISVSQGAAEIRLHVEGGYTVYDLEFYTDNGSTVNIEDGAVIVSMASDTVLSISPKDRSSGDMAKVTFKGDGGSSDGKDSVQISVPVGMTIIDSEIPTFVKSRAEYGGIWLTAEDRTEYDFGSQVLGDLVLVPDWKSRGTVVFIDVDCGDVLLDGTAVEQFDFEEGSAYSLVLAPYPGYDPIEWCYVVDGVLNVLPAGEPLVIEGLADDLVVTVTYSYYSSSSGLISSTYHGMPTDLTSTVKMWEAGGVIDKSESAWRGHSSVPLIVDDYVYLRIYDKIYKVESDTGYVVKTAPSYSTNAFYHQLGYGHGMIIDYYTDKVYDTDLELLFTVDKSFKGYEYYDGYFWNSGTSLYRFPADASQAVDGVMYPEKVGDFAKPVYSSYGFAMSAFDGGYVYRVYVEGSQRGITAMCIDDSSPDYGRSTYVAMPSLERSYLDDGWISMYEGTIYLGGYTNGLFGAVAKNADDSLAYVKADGLEFGEVKDYTFDGKRGFISQMVAKNGIGFICVSATLYAFSMNEDGSLGELLGSESFIFSHGSIVVDWSYSTEDNGRLAYVYMIPYSGENVSFGIMECHFGDDGYVMSRTTTDHIVRDYCSQAVRAGSDGQMIWYNDSGHVFGYTSPGKNPYYFFLDDGSQAGWHVAYGKNAYEAAKSLGSQLLVIDGNAEVSRMFGKVVSESSITVVHAPANTVMQYEWAAVDSFSNRSYDTDHYWMITANGAAVSEGDVLSYIDGEGVSECSFAENIGDRSLLGLKMAPGTDVSTVRFYEGGAEIADSAMIGVIGTEVPGSFPNVYREGYMPVWTDAGGNAVESLSGTSFAEGGTAYHLAWAEIPTYEVSNIEAGAAPGTVSLSFDVLTIDTDPLRVSVMLGFEDGTFASTESTVAAVDGAASLSWSARAPGIPVQMALEISKGGVPVYQSFDNPFEGVGYTYSVGTVMVIDGLVYEVTSMEPEAATIVGYESAPSGKLVIPAALEVDGHSFVLTVGKKAFDRCYEITSVTTGADIEPYAFYGCSGLKVVRISDGVSSIGKSAFSSCPRISYVVIADSVSEIGKNAFYGCAFYSGDEKLDPTSEDLSGHKFTGKRTHLDVYVPPVGGVFSAGGLKYKIVSNGDEMSVALRGFSSEAFPDVTVPSSVRYLGFDWKVSSVANKAFYGNDVLASVTVEMDGSVGFKSFAACPSLESVAVTGSATLGSYSFASCPSLAVLDLSGVSEIGVSAFSGDKGLVSVAFSEGLVSVGKNAFFRNLFYDGSSKVPRTAAGLAGKAFAGSGGELFLSA